MSAVKFFDEFNPRYNICHDLILSESQSEKAKDEETTHEVKELNVNGFCLMLWFLYQKKSIDKLQLSGFTLDFSWGLKKGLSSRDQLENDG